MIDERFPNWDIDVEKGTVYSLRFKKYIGTLDEYGYIRIKPPKGYKHWTIHQYIWMVANQSEIPNGYDIHHIDGNKQNNCIDNLELIEHQEHMKEHKQNISNETKEKIRLFNIGKFLSEETKKKIRENNPMKVKIAQYTSDGELVKIWDSIGDACRDGFTLSNISNCCRGKRKTHKGFVWKYYNEKKDVA